ncbi:MAG: MFS transporter, partial [Anaerolineales bacterium]
METKMRWYDHVTINLAWLGLNVASGVITPVMLPYLVALFVPPALKNTYLAQIRVVSLAMAMLVQPLSGTLSDRNTSSWGRRRPYILGGTLFDLLFLVLVGSSVLFIDNTALDNIFEPIFGVGSAYVILMVGIVLLQISSNVAHGALQGLIPDLVPKDQRGRASGVKAVMELLPAFMVIFVGPLVDAGKIWLTVSIIAGSLLITTLGTVLSVREVPLKEKPSEPIRERVLRLVALTVIFVGVTRGAVWLVGSSGDWLTQRQAPVEIQVALVGLAGLLGMAGSIILGVYFGAWMGIGQEARQQRSFIWWVVNRLLFLAAVGSIQGFAQFFLSDVLEIPNPATVTTLLTAVVG